MTRTAPGDPVWHAAEGVHRAWEGTAVIGRGEEAWRRAAHDVLRWAVKTRSGFAVPASAPVAPGERVTVTARVLGVAIREPVEVVAVVEGAERVGFAYATRPGHPVDGEECFVVHRDGDAVLLTVRSLTAPAPRGPWRALFPLLLVAQRVARRRYLRALR
ncbi:DUF1990 family protein [Arenivirga flava]|uniref:DUF1990 domain-containing protein n=1 Tax=Arenivirga flava TaxID=1930060 RepID=A0AA37XCR8_9MICO|nr:DUF1990 family protein [Arenivirga flava]GMA28742.1 hypothetical protein GCM10025874_19950 [Arenivirga flava]